MKTGILVASFGTTYVQAADKAIAPIIHESKQRYPQAQVAQAYTSNLVRAALKKRGVDIPDAPAAMRSLAQAGVEQLYILPTHLLYGEEYGKLCTQAESEKHRFAQVRIAQPLLENNQALADCIVAMETELSPAEEECLIWVGHGSPTFANVAYAALDYMCKESGRKNVFVGAMESYPDLAVLLEQLKQSPYRKVLLAPLLLVAGDHAHNDIGGDEPDSWKSILQAEGYQVRCDLRGLGEYAAIRALYQRRLDEAMQGSGAHGV